MADFHVDVGVGDDANPGTAASPVRSIMQATRLAAASPDPTGTILVASGIYEPPNESFPLLLRPGYALQGAGRERTLIRFTGEVRTTSGSGAIYWGGFAIQVGSALRDLTLRANPVPPGYSCSGMVGIHAIEDGTVIERVDVLGPQLPEEGLIPIGEALSGFLVSVYIEGADVTYRDSRVRLGGPVCVTRGGASLLDGLRLEGPHGLLLLSGEARVQRSLFRLATVDGPWASAVRGIEVAGGRPTIGPSNIIAMASNPNIDCAEGAAVTIVDNLMISGSAGIFIRDGASARIVNNLLAGGTIRVMSDAAPYSVFEGNVFHVVFANAYWQPTLRVAVPTDFGGGPAGSRGRNHFGPMGRSYPDHVPAVDHAPFIMDIPGGGDVHAADNYWIDGRPVDQTMSAPGTRLIATGPLVDPRTQEDVRDERRRIRSEVWGG